MSIIELVVLGVIAAITGAIGQALAGYSMGGCLVSAIIGYIGAFIGMWLARQFGLPEPFTVMVGDQAFPILWSIIGSLVLTLLLGLISRRRTVVYE